MNASWFGVLSGWMRTSLVHWCVARWMRAGLVCYHDGCVQAWCAVRMDANWFCIFFQDGCVLAWCVVRMDA